MPITAILPNLELFAANCHANFFFLPTWYKYLQLDPNTCEVVNFQVPGDFLLIFLAILDIALRLSALVAIGYVITGGVKYVTSQGEPARTKEAFGTILNALIGLAIALIATGAVGFIGNRIG